MTWWAYSYLPSQPPGRRRFCFAPSSFLQRECTFSQSTTIAGCDDSVCAGKSTYNAGVPPKCSACRSACRLEGENGGGGGSSSSPSNAKPKVLFFDGFQAHSSNKIPTILGRPRCASDFNQQKFKLTTWRFGLLRPNLVHTPVSCSNVWPNAIKAWYDKRAALVMWE